MNSIAGTLLTAALLMRAIDRKKYHFESLEFLNKLKTFDVNRTGYYNDLANKWSIEDCLADWILALEENRNTPIDLANLNLFNLHYKQYLCVADQINLTNNQFEANRVNEISSLLNNCCVKFDF